MKNIIITGSTRGIGFAMAKEFLKVGCSVSFQGEVRNFRGNEGASETL